ncbi:MAG: YIP1 family protein [Aestuariivita sp.]|nr:YIP1 family protein [Aestuariivita sp.]MCY4201065.1 YIP1 family protein [Aestuariivita sp.]MCY4288869.1 YIP1 family protein [Aestuariivita sp.]MCY4345223.1 YIP1 family protein [Aestuariivita sp.]
MPLTKDIVATYFGPRRVMRHLMSIGCDESRALMFLYGFCAISFVAQTPRLARQSHLTGQDISALMGGTLLATLLFLPLIFYGLAAITQLVRCCLRRPGTGFGARLSLFWSLLATTPILLLHGLVAGFLGAGSALNIVSVVWFGFFLWFWFETFRVSGELSS